MSETDVPMATLRTGEEVLRTTVDALRLSLRGIYQNPQCPMAFYELVMACRDAEHIVFGSVTRKLLTDLGLFESVDQAGHARIHDDIRRVVLAASEGEAPEFRLVSPLRDAPAS